MLAYKLGNPLDSISLTIDQVHYMNAYKHPNGDYLLTWNLNGAFQALVYKSKAHQIDLDIDACNNH
jgi:hypothetical protein